MFDHEKLKVFFRGEIVPFDKAVISVANTGFLYGLGIFTGMRAHLRGDDLFLFRPKCHFKRLQQSCKLFRYENFLKDYDYEKFLGILKELFSVNNIKEDTYIRVTNFSDENKISPKFIGYRDTLAIYLYPLGDYVPTTGMRCKVSSWRRVDDNAMPARAKINGSYVNTAFAKTEALLDGYDEAIFLDQNNHVVEGSAENIFIVINEQLITPPPSSPILEGITRSTVIELAISEGLKVIEREIDRSELYKADEVLLTGTGARVSPVIEIDKIKVGDGSIGPVGRLMQERYSQVTRGELSQFKDWVVRIG